MVTLFALLTICAGAELPAFFVPVSEPVSSTRLTMEFSKQRVYKGERFSVHFILHSASPFEEVEVARFPEFDGFWSENLSLRQGRIILSKGHGTQFKTEVGAYDLTSRVRRTHPRIEPMHLVLKNSNRTILSTGTMPQFIEIPENTQSNAVGRFTINFDPHKNFHPNEPTAVTITLQGEGNFHEIDPPALNLPETVELLSERSTLAGHGLFLSKSFEYILAVHSTKAVTIPKADFRFFNPRDKQIRSLALGPIELLALAPRASSTFSSPSETPSRERPGSLLLHPLVLITHGGLGIILVALYFLKRKTSRTRPKPAPPPDPQPQQIHWSESFQRSIEAGNIDQAVATLYAAIARWLTQLTGPHPSRSIALSRLERRYGAAVATKIGWLLDSCDRHLYAQTKDCDFNPLEAQLEFESVSRACGGAKPLV